MSDCNKLENSSGFIWFDEVVPRIAFDLLNNVARIYKDNGNQFPAETLQALNSLFGNVFIESTQLLETATFTSYKNTDSSRTILKVDGRSEHQLLFPNINYCSCRFFVEHVLRNSSVLTCKHVLSAYLAQATEKFNVKVITDSQLAEILDCNFDMLEMTK